MIKCIQKTFPQFLLAYPKGEPIQYSSVTCHKEFQEKIIESYSEVTKRSCVFIFTDSLEESLEILSLSGHNTPSQKNKGPGFIFYFI